MNPDKTIKFEEVEQLFGKYEKIHPNMFFKISKEKFEKELKKSSENWENLNIYEKYYEIMRLNALIGDIHTTIPINIKSKNMMPYELTKCKDGICISNLDQKYINREMMYSKILEVNNVSIEEIIEMGKKIIPSENPKADEASIAKRLNQLNFLKILGIVDPDSDKFSITVLDNDEVKNFEVTALNKVQEQKVNFVKKYPINFDYNENKDYFYIDINRFILNRQHGVNFLYKLQTKAEKAVSDGKPIIVDVRDNGGGNPYLFFDFYNYLKEINAQGYCIVNNLSASASVDMANLLKNAGFSLVGTSLKQSPTFYASPKNVLTTANLEGCVSTGLVYKSNPKDVMGKIPPRDANLYQEALSPDIVLEPTIDDLKNNRDICLDYCVEQIKNGAKKIEKINKYEEDEFI